MRDKERVWIWMGGEDRGGVGEETVILIYCMKKISFQ